jgi:hypothetical protein
MVTTLVVARAAHAETDAVPDAVQYAIFDAVLGPAVFLRTRSKAIGHSTKPALRLGARVDRFSHIELGAAFTAVLDDSPHYRVLGLLAHARFPVWRGPRVLFGAGVALGVGRDADILHTDLRAEHALVPYGFAAFDVRWRLGPSFQLGLEAGWENLSVARAGALMGWSWERAR